MARANEFSAEAPSPRPPPPFPNQSMGLIAQAVAHYTMPDLWEVTRHPKSGSRVLAQRAQN